LNGEKIDIIVFSKNPKEYAKSALSPAKPTLISILDIENKILQATVTKDQLSLAIGKKGINVRLASRLVGWRIDIKSD
jgi:N utilization substance protein A